MPEGQRGWRCGMITISSRAARYAKLKKEADRCGNRGPPVLEQLVEVVLEFLIPLCEMMGILVIAVSTCTAFWQYFRGLLTRTPGDVKSQLASGLALSLEFKMAAEILKTVLVRDMTELMVLGAVIILRALLSFLIHFEMKQHDTSNHETLGGIVK